MELKRQEYVHENLPKGFMPYTIYEIINNKQTIGHIVLREGSIQERYYDGHVAYHIDEAYRGHGYAYQACLLLEKYIKDKEVIITCDPQNIASLKTIEKLNTHLLEIKTIPSHLRKFFTKEEKQKSIYLWTIKRKESKL